MSSVPTSRASRRRILVVGPVQLEAAIQAAETIKVDTIFQALGEIAICPAGRPIEIVLLAPDSQEDLDDLVHSAEAIRRLDATVQIALICSTPVAPSIAEHFDHHLAPPVQTTSINELLEGPVTQQQGTAEPVPVILPPPATPTTPTTASVTPPSPKSTSHDEPDPLPQGIGRLGDTDLVESMLHDARGVRPMALRLIMQQTGWTDVRIEQSSERPDNAPIQFGGREFGVLSAPGQSRESIRPWANWIARWIALDDAQHELRDMAFRDELTAAWNRRYLKEFLTDAIEEARRMRRQLTVMVFDIDDFKSYNDQFGHAAGDTILRDTVQLLGSVIRDGDRVCRIGGDEFAVVFADMQAPRTPGSAHPESVETIARRFQEQICGMRFPELGLHAPGTLSISGGLSSYPWDGQTGSELLRIADERALESKRRGKNCLTIGRGARTEWPDQE